MCCNTCIWCAYFSIFVSKRWDQKYLIYPDTFTLKPIYNFFFPRFIQQITDQVPRDTQDATEGTPESVNTTVANTTVTTVAMTTMTSLITNHTDGNITTPVTLAPGTDIILHTTYEHLHEKPNNLGFWPGRIQTGLYAYSHWNRLEAWNFGLQKKRDYTICLTKTKTLISYAATAQLWSTALFSHVQIVCFLMRRTYECHPVKNFLCASIS